MSLSVTLLAGVLLASTPGQTADQVLFPRLERGQELLYRGLFLEAAARPGVRFRRNYGVELRVFVLERDAQGYDLAILTLLKPSEQGPAIVGFDLARLSLQGKLHPSPLAPIEGPPLTEVGMFVNIPTGRLGEGTAWDSAEDGRPPRAWKMVGTENYRGTHCYRLTGVQMSDEWGRARIERAAWKRTDQVWLAPFNGYASAVERLIETQDPSSAEPNSRYQLRYDLETKLLYPGQLSEERRIEIAAIARFGRELNEWLPKVGSVGSRPFEQLEAKIAQFIQHAQPTPYREALLSLQRKAIAARKGHVPPVAVTNDRGFDPVVLKVGQPAPEFLTTDLITSEQVRLSRLRGNVAVVLYFNAEAASAEPTLRFMESLREKLGARVGLLAVAMKGNASLARSLQEKLGIRVPIASGDGARKTQRIETTPCFVVLDAAGVVRVVSEGWGSETSPVILRELDRWINR